MSIHPPPHILKRICITLGLGVAFIMMASIFSPDRSRADESASPRRQPKAYPLTAEGAEVSVDAHAGLRSLGVIESGRYSVAIFSTDVGPRYTIIARETGEELGTLLTADLVEQLLPEIDLKSMDFSTPDSDRPQQLMLAEPQS